MSRITAILLIFSLLFCLGGYAEGRWYKRAAVEISLFIQENIGDIVGAILIGALWYGIYHVTTAECDKGECYVSVYVGGYIGPWIIIDP